METVNYVWLRLLEVSANFFLETQLVNGNYAFDMAHFDIPLALSLDSATSGENQTLPEVSCILLSTCPREIWSGGPCHLC